MTWLVWRQRREEAIGIALVLAGLGLVVLPMGVHLHHVAAAFSLGRCGSASPGAVCAWAVDAFDAASRLLTGLVPWLSFLPGLLGVFVGAPLIARELEEGTWRRAWSQSVTRRRWLRAQLTGAGLLVVAGAAVLTVIFTWWLTPLGQHQRPPGQRRLRHLRPDPGRLVGRRVWHRGPGRDPGPAGGAGHGHHPGRLPGPSGCPSNSASARATCPPSPCGARRRITPCPPETCSWGSERWRRTATTS